VLRPQGQACDSGAFELAAPTFGSVSATVGSLVSTLAAGSVSSLMSSLSAAQASADKGNITPAVNQLGAFINKVQALVKSNRLDAIPAKPLSPRPNN
jgi:hypothetical protein